MDELKFVCSLNINEYKKAESMYKLVSDGRLSQSDVIDFLMQNEYIAIAEIFLSFDSNDVRKRKLTTVSGNEWDEEQLDYFSVVFEDINENDICEIVEVDGKAKQFLAENSSFTQTTFVGKKDIDLANAATSDFQRKVMFVLLNPSKESCVDVMMQSFLENILDSRFLVEQRYKMPLLLSKKKREATADVVAILFPQIYVGVIVVEDKPEDTSETEQQQSRIEAQLVAEGIAVAQQKHWPKDSPVYMLRVLKTSISIYKANFTDEFINSIKNGTRRLTPFVVKRFAPAPSFVIGRIRPGCDIIDKNDRELIVKLVYSISKDIISRN